ncbi:MAG: hypothetical protein KIH69_004385 [Anaerolineae bacterium]|nr:hypothetical protein [Anaerolineae bacterium]
MRTNTIASLGVMMLTLSACASNVTPTSLPPIATNIAIISTVVAPTAAPKPSDVPTPTAQASPTLAPKATPRPQPSPTQPPAPPKLDMRKVNWAQTLASEPLLTVDKSAPSIGGNKDLIFVKEKNKPDAEAVTGYADPKGVVYGDFSGDSQEEAIFHLQSGGTAGDIGLLVFGAGPDGKAKLVATLPGYKMGAQIAKGELVVVAPQYAGWEPNCCASAMLAVRYQLKEGKLVKLGEKVEPFAQAREATVRQYYSFLANKDYKSAYAFLQPNMQKLVSLEQFTAGEKAVLARDIRAVTDSLDKNIVGVILTEARLDKTQVRWQTDGINWDMQWNNTAKQWLMAFGGSAGGLQQSVGTVTGELTYPSEGIPPLQLYARNLDYGFVVGQKTLQNQQRYTLTLPAGNYDIFAYPQGLTGTVKLAGGYSTYSQCIEKSKPENCKQYGDWLTVNVSPGQVTAKVNLNDWYAQPQVIPAPPGAKETEALVRGRAAQVLMALQSKNGAALAALTHPSKGLRFSPYATANAKDIVLTAAQLKAAYADKTVRKWGVSDGIGEPINLTFDAYAKKFVYSLDFLNAPEFSYNKRLGNGNSIHNLPQFYPNSVFVEHYFPDPTGDGIQWRSLRLVFQLEKGEWMLIGVAHDQWTT